MILRSFCSKIIVKYYVQDYVVFRNIRIPGSRQQVTESVENMLSDTTARRVYETEKTG